MAEKTSQKAIWGIIILSVIVSIPLILALIGSQEIVYDNFDTTTINWTKWINMTTFDTSGDSYISQSVRAGNLSVSCGWAVAYQCPEMSMNSLLLPNYHNIRNLTIRTSITIEDNLCSNGGKAELKVFGKVISNRTANGAANNIWNIDKDMSDSTRWILSNESGVVGYITPSNSIITANVSGNGAGCGAGGQVGRVVIDYVNYTTMPAVEINITNQTYNSTTYETLTEGFYVNITYDNDTYSSITGSLVYNEVSYSATKTTSGNTAQFTRNIAVPLQNSVNFYWNFQLINSSGTEQYYSIPYSQSVSPISFGLCNSTLSTKYINITFKDEATLAAINSSIISSTWQYWIGGGSVNKTLSYSNSALTNPSYAFCFSPPDRTINFNTNFQYSFTDYPQRTWTASSTLSNSTLNKVLYLLSSTDGMYVTFQVVDAGDSPIVGVSVNATRTDTELLVGNGVTGDDGGITFWLNPNYPHRFTFSKAGFTTLNSLITPTQPAYTVHLSSTSASNITMIDYYRDISYYFAPVASYLDNNTLYTFNFTISSGYWALQKYGFTLSNESTQLASITNTDAGGTAIYNLNTNNNTMIIMRYFWVINGTYTNATTSWTILDTSGSEWSISVFFSDLKTYMNSGMFGLDNFGLALITFFSIFIITGIMSYKYGLNSPAAIMGILFALTLFFDVGLDLIPYPSWINSSIPVATVFIGIIFIGVLFKEVSN